MEKKRIENDLIVTTSSSSSSSSSTARRGGAAPRAIQCPPLVIAPTHGTLQLLPQRQVPPTIESVESLLSSPSNKDMPSTNASMMSDAMRRPVQITADPRIYRGSVFANRRLANDRARQAEKEESKEKRYRVGVIRDQLTTILPRVPMGKVRGQTTTTTQKTRSSTYLPDISSHHSLNVSIDKARGGGTRSFTTARFAPVRSSAKIGNGDVFGKNQTKEKSGSSQFPVKVVVNFEKAIPSEGPPVSRRPIRHVALSQTATPPPSSRKVYPIVDSGVQTDDNFDQKFEDFVKELANSAIERAQTSLETENALREVRKTAEATEHELRAVTRKQNILSADWRRQMQQKNRELENWKHQESQAREAQRLAQATCEEVTRKTLENIRTLEKNSRKSIGLDTRDMVILQNKMDLVTAELEKDFFPWIFRRAERLFRHKIARGHYDQSMLNELRHRREMAKKRLINFDSYASH